MTDYSFNNSIPKLLRPPEVVPSEHAYFYMFTTCGYLLTGLLQLLISAWLVIQGMLPLAGLCGALSLSFFSAVMLNLRGHLQSGLIVVLVAQGAQAAAAVYISGNTGFQHYLIPLLVITVLFPSQRKIIGILLGALVSLEYVILTHLSPQTAPACLTYAQTASILNKGNLYLSLVGMFLAAIYYGFAAEQAGKTHKKNQKQTRSLLHNVLPEEIAHQLEQAPGTITEGFDNATILFSDIVGFTNLSRSMPPDEVVDLLNRIFSRFDDLAEKHGLEKIKTIGDAYMCTAGIPLSRDDHAEIAACMALEMMAEFYRISREIGKPLSLRIGINSGAVVAGVIGKKKFSYDLWGNAVNAASRMASHGMPGEIQVTKSTCELLKEKFIMEERGSVDIKGIGPMTTFLLKGARFL